jgi:glutamate-1-semialdehyde 2,1-aminomutase
MAELIHALVPSIEKVRMCNSGTEATMSAVRLARGLHRRDKIIKFSGCYHGHSDSLLIKAGSGALTHGNPDSAGIPAAFARETVVLPFNDPAGARRRLRGQPGPDRRGHRRALSRQRRAHPADEPGFLAHLRAACTANGALLIFDEVMTGFRLARGGVQEIEGIVPDLTALGKIIGGGLPVGAFGGRAEIMDQLRPARARLPGGHAERQPAGHGRRHRGARAARGVHALQGLDALGRRVRDALRARARRRACRPRSRRPVRCSASSSRRRPCTTTRAR